MPKRVFVQFMAGSLDSQDSRVDDGSLRRHGRTSVTGIPQPPSFFQMNLSSLTQARIGKATDSSAWAGVPASAHKFPPRTLWCSRASPI